MSLKVIKCPGCGANLELDTSREFAFCLYCGVKIQLHEVLEIRHSGKVSIDSRSSEIEQLIKNCEAQLKFYDYKKAYDFAQRLVADFSNEPMGYVLIVRSLTHNFDKNMIDTIDIDTYNLICSYLTKLKRLDNSAYKSFYNQGKLYAGCIAETTKIKNLVLSRRNSKYNSENKNIFRALCVFALLGIAMCFGIMPICFGIIAEYNGESAIIIGGVILVISVISSILVIYKWGESKANLKESLNSMDNNIAISEEKLKQYKKELYGE